MRFLVPIGSLVLFERLQALFAAYPPIPLKPMPELERRYATKRVEAAELDDVQRLRGQSRYSIWFSLRSHWLYLSPLIPTKFCSLGTSGADSP